MVHPAAASRVPTEQQVCVSQLGDLEHDPHPIFHEHNFHCKIDHTALGPTLRLASRFLTTTKLLHFWHAAFFGTVKELHSTSSPDQQPSSLELHFSGKPRLTAAQIKRTKYALLKLGSKMRFRPSSSRKIARFTVEGRLSGIAISEAHITKMRTLSTTDRDEYTWATFELAIAILYALAHAVMHKFRRQGARYYLRGSNTAELGYEWESTIFGGVIMRIGDSSSDSNGHVKNEIALLRWPGATLVNLQHVHGNSVGMRARRPPFVARGELVGRVPFEFVEGIYCEAFWASVVRQGREALRPRVEDWRRLQVCKGWRDLHSAMLNPDGDMNFEKRRWGSARYVLPKKFY